MRKQVRVESPGVIGKNTSGIAHSLFNFCNHTKFGQMKKTLLLILVSLQMINVVIGQSGKETIKVVTLDFKERDAPDFGELKNIKKGKFFRIQINNFNNNLWKVSLASIDTVSSKPQTTPVFGNFDLDAIAKLAAGVSPLTTTVTESATFKDFGSQSSKMTEIIEDFSVGFTNKNKVITDEIKKHNQSLSQAKNTMTTVGKEIDDLKLEIYKIRLRSQLLENNTGSFDFNSTLNRIENIRKTTEQLRSELVRSKSSYESFSDSHQPEIGKDPELLKSDKALKELFEKSLTAVLEIQNSVTADKANELLTSVVSIANNTQNTYKSFPIQFMGEQTKVHISFVPRDEKSNLHSFSMPFTFPAVLRKYSVVGMSLYASSLKDDIYSTVKTKTNDSSYTYDFKKEDGNDLELGTAALLRFGSKFYKEFIGFHGTIGAGISISNKIRPRALVGAGFSFGGKHMFAVDFGLITGYVDRLSTTVNIAQTYPEKPENIVVSKLSAGGFGSLGYIYQF
ncbi:MAG: hypothetical protein JWQ40_151 [Segetibacter sp.]|nr:hypothetical protein [Segetibacter sp.]